MLHSWSLVQFYCLSLVCANNFDWDCSYCSSLHWAVPEKIQTRGGVVEGVTPDKIFRKIPGNVGLSLYPKKFQTNWSFTPWRLQKLCYTPRKFQDLYSRLVEIPHDHPCKFLFLTTGMSTFYIFSTHVISMSSTHTIFFFLLE